MAKCIEEKYGNREVTGVAVRSTSLRGFVFVVELSDGPLEVVIDFDGKVLFEDKD